jgi:hypothetical protein
MLADPLTDIRETALESLATFGQHGKLQNSYYVPSIDEQLYRELGHINFISRDDASDPPNVISSGSQCTAMYTAACCYASA